MKTQELLALLGQERFVSGEQIAAAAGVSRAAVAKAIAKLRQEGYEIEAVKHRGYCLCSKPDRLSADEIRTALADHPWSERVTVLDSVDSTNDRLRTLAMHKAEEGTVLLAEQQTAGKGRMGRSFVSPPKAGIYLSVLLRPEQKPEALMTLTARAAVAAALAIETCCGVKPGIKWVNDLQLNGRKICGILTELSLEAESGRVNYAIIGVGVNCNLSLEDFPATLQGVAGSIRSEAGIVVDRNALAAELIRRLSRLQSQEWRSFYLERCTTVGRRVTVLDADAPLEAEVIDVGERAELIVRLDDGTLRAVNSGEVSVIPCAQEK